MSKKSYKRNQNRLYREIKRRIIAEQASKFPVPIIEIHRDIKTLAIRNVIQNHFVREEIEFVKTDMANKLASKLIDEGFVEFFSRENRYEPIIDVTEIEARIRVVKPRQEGLEMLKEQEVDKKDDEYMPMEAIPVTTGNDYRTWLCSACGSNLHYGKELICPKCHRKIDWQGR